MVTLLIHQSLTVPRFFEFLQSGCQPYAQTTITGRPAVKPQILLQRSIA